MKVANKVIVVTGGGSGIGRELVLELLRRNARVATIDIHQAALDETAMLAGVQSANLATFEMNVTDRAVIETLPDKVVERFGQVDGVINNAGIVQPFIRLNDLDYETIDRVMEINFRGALYVTKTFLPILLTRPAAHIVNISSMGGFMPVPGQTIYGASKAAVKLMTEGLWAEMLDTNVRVTAVFPGGVATNIMTNSGVEMPTVVTDGELPAMLAADEAARIILDGMEEDAYQVMVGPDAEAMDHLYRENPSQATTLMAEQMKGLLQPA